MSNFWIIRHPAAPVEGPFTGAQVKDMAMRGDLSPDAMVAGDGTQWAPARRVKGLVFGAGGAASASLLSPEAPPQSLTPESPLHERDSDNLYQPESGTAGAAQSDAIPAALPVAPPVMHPPLQPTASATVALGVADHTGRASIGRPRTVVPLVVAASALIALGVVQMVLGIVEMVNQAQSSSATRFNANWMDSAWQPSETLSCGVFIGNLALWGFWVAWLFVAHADVAQFTQRRYHTSPGLALGLCFVPLFNIYWQVATPYKLARFVEEHFRQRSIVAAAAWSSMHPPVHAGGTPRSPTSAVAVMVLMICAYPANCLLPGTGMLLFAISALLIQRGLNRIWTDAMTPVAATPAPY